MNKEKEVETVESLKVKNELLQQVIEKKAEEMARENHAWLHRLSNGEAGTEHLRMEYEHLRKDFEDMRMDFKDLCKKYEHLRKDYEHLRKENV